jgi:hypothetical protein
MLISYQGFGPAAILLMALCLAVSEIIKYYKRRQHH